MGDAARPNRMDAVVIADRRRQVAALYLGRQTMETIARKLSVHQSTISDDLIALRAEWKEEHRADIDALVTREAAELSEMEGQAAVKFSQTGEVEWLAARLKVKERRAKLLGLDAPARADITSGGQTITGEWITIQSVLLAALESYPDARAAAATALLALEEGNGANGL